LGRLARTTPSIRSSGCFSTCSYRNRIAESAWFCVDAATCSSTARLVRNRLTSVSASRRGCGKPEPSDRHASDPPSARRERRGGPRRGGAILAPYRAAMPAVELPSLDAR
jgi:hypothetical protein